MHRIHEYYFTIACENIRFSSVFAAGDVCETSPAAESEEKRMFSQANFTVESKNIPERCNRSFRLSGSLFNSCLINLVYIIARKRMQILEGGDQISKKQFVLCNRRSKNYS